MHLSKVYTHLYDLKFILSILRNYVQLNVVNIMAMQRFLEQQQATLQSIAFSEVLSPVPKLSFLPAPYRG